MLTKQSKNLLSDPTSKLDEPLWERIWVAIIIIVTLTLTAVPFIWGIAVQPPGQQYTGIFFNAHDTNTYLAKMNLGRRGEWLFTLQHTPESGGNGGFLYIFYILLGKVAGLLNVANQIVFQGARLLFGAVFLVVVYRFLQYLFNVSEQRRFAFSLICFTAGLGWIVSPLGWVPPPPADFWIQEALTFLLIFSAPHFALATALLLTAVQYTLRGLETGETRFYVWGGLALAGLTLIHPFMLAPFGLVFGIIWLRRCLQDRTWRWQEFFRLAGVGIAGLPGVAITWYALQSDALLRQWQNQAESGQIDFFEWLILYGLLVPFILLGFYWAERVLPKTQPDSPFVLRWQVITVWAISGFVLATIPLGYAQRFAEGMHFFVCCLASAGWYAYVAPRLGEKTRNYARLGFTIFATFSTLAIIGASVSYIYLPKDNLFDATQAPYLSAGESGAIAWLNQNAPDGSVVLTGPLLGNVLPARANVRVVYGHLYETIDAEGKLQQVRNFFRADFPNGERSAIILRWRVKFLVYGWREREAGSFDPSTSGWRKVYDVGGVQIYDLTP